VRLPQKSTYKLIIRIQEGKHGFERPGRASWDSSCGSLGLLSQRAQHEEGLRHGLRARVPKDGATFKCYEENVPVQLTPLSAVLTFAPKVYEVSVDGRPHQHPRNRGTPATVLKNLSPGEHTVTAVAKDAKGKVWPSARPSSSAFRRRLLLRRLSRRRAAAAGRWMDLVAEAGKYLKDIFFDFDKSDIRADQKESVDAAAKWLREHTTVGITVEGTATSGAPASTTSPSASAGPTRSVTPSSPSRRSGADQDDLLRQGTSVLHRAAKEMAAKEACWHRTAAATSSALR